MLDSNLWPHRGPLWEYAAVAVLAVLTWASMTLTVMYLLGRMQTRRMVNYIRADDCSVWTGNHTKHVPLATIGMVFFDCGCSAVFRRVHVERFWHPYREVHPL